jgi:anthranilate synthase/indole-3-glycerol phosphate synthase/phosphoribosylanthranilate isomerase
LVKICGLQTVDAAVTATMAGADMLGMILAHGTKRTVPLARASEIVNVVRSLRGGSDSIRMASTVNGKVDGSDNSSTSKSIAGSDWFSYQAQLVRSHPHKPLIVGVFRDQPLEEIVSTATKLKLDAVQLHGRTEHIEWSKYLPGVLVIRVFHVDSHVDTNVGPGEGDLADATRESYHHIIALDTASATKGAEGGSGLAFDWSVAERLATHDPIGKRVMGVAPRRLPVMLGGGLNADNVAQAIAQAQPFIVDTSSGVETDGVKDVAKVQAFVRAVKGDLTV